MQQRGRIVSSNPEQRENTRFPHVSVVTYEDLDKGLHYQSKMYNYSKDGLYFESDLKLAVGDRVFIGIENSPYAEQSNTYECYCAIIKRREVLDNSMYDYGYGVQYGDPTEPHEPADSDSAASEPCPPPDQAEAASVQNLPKDKRRHKRIRLSKTVDCFSKHRPFRGVVKNLSPSGAFIETDQRFAVGENLALALPFVKKGQSAMLKVEVVWKNEQGIGVKFQKPSSQ